LVGVVAALFYWWVTILNADKALVEDQLHLLALVPPFIFALLGCMLGDFESEAVKSKGIKKFVVLFLGPILRTPYGIILPLLLACVLAFFVLKFTAIRFQLPSVANGQRKALKVFYESEAGNSVPITEKLKETPWIIQFAPAKVWRAGESASEHLFPRLVFTDEYGFRKNPKPLETYFDWWKYLSGSSTDPTEALANIDDQLLAPITVHLTYYDSNNNQRHRDGTLNVTPDIFSDPAFADMPRDLFKRIVDEWRTAAKNGQKSPPIQTESPAIAISPSVDGKAANFPVEVDPPTFQIEFGERGYNCKYSPEKSELIVNQDPPGNLSAAALEKVREEMEYLALHNDPSTYDNLVKQLGPAASQDFHLLWGKFFECLQNDMFWEDLQNARRMGFAKVIALFSANDDWISEKSVSCFLEGERKILLSGDLNPDCQCTVLGMFCKLVRRGRDADRSLVPRFLYDLHANLVKNWHPSLQAWLWSQLQDDQIVSDLRDDAQDLYDCVQLLISHADNDTRRKINDLEERLKSDISDREALKEKLKGLASNPSIR